jgi:Septum formation
VTDPGREQAANVRLGDCIETWPKDGLVVNLQVTPCTSRHQGEVFAVDQLPAGSYPGAAEVEKQTEELCSRHADLLRASELPTLNLAYLYPASTNWARGDRKVSCIALTASGSRTSSVRR